MFVRLSDSRLIFFLRDYRRLASLDEFYRFCAIDFFSLRLSSKSLPPDRLLFLLEVYYESLLLGRRVDVLKPGEHEEQASQDVDGDRKHDSRHSRDLRLFFSFSKVRFHHSGCVASITL